MPRSIDEILQQADKLADRFEQHEPDPSKIRDATALRDLVRAFKNRAEAERRLVLAVAKAREDGHSWNLIGTMIGTSGEAARQRYGHAAGTNSERGER